MTRIPFLTFRKPWALSDRLKEIGLLLVGAGMPPSWLVSGVEFRQPSILEHEQIDGEHEITIEAPDAITRLACYLMPPMSGPPN